MKTMVIVWLVTALLFLIAELGNPGLFFFFSFFLGAFITAFCSFFITSYIAQLFIFLGGTTLAFLLLQVWIRSRGVRLSKGPHTNIYALKGKRALVVQTIGPNKPGYITLDGVLWLARSVHNNTIAEAKWVEIVDVRGAHVLVMEVSEESAT